MKIALCQLNPLVGDVHGNTALLCRTIEERQTSGCDLFIFPELFIQGYPPRDLLEKEWFVRQSLAAHEQVCTFSAAYPEIGIIFGTILPAETPFGKRLYNSALLIQAGKILLAQHKTLLPTYDIFDETRYFQPGSGPSTVVFRGIPLGISICEDAWNPPDVRTGCSYNRDPVAELAAAGARLFINISASPFFAGKERLRYDVMRSHAANYRLPFAFVNQVGGNDDLVFDGNSMMFDSEGSLSAAAPAFCEAVTVVDLEHPGAALPPPQPDRSASVHEALVLGTRDYVRKCGFSRVLLGLSGGIDSALTAVIAARAVGPENVWGVTMPSRYSSSGSVDDSETLAKRLGIRFSRIPIEGAFSALLDTLAPVFSGTQSGIAEENLQARIRGTILMALSNKFTMLLLSTGNKSELAVGYSTLYGDMNGGLSVISDLPKEMVYQLAAYINRQEEVIPAATITKPPSAELRPDQKDQDTLPPYPTLDAILERLIERGVSKEDIVAEGFDASTVAWIASAVARNEYKRRQAAPGLKVTSKAFGTGRRFPLAARYDWS